MDRLLTDRDAAKRSSEQAASYLKEKNIPDSIDGTNIHEQLPGIMEVWADATRKLQGPRKHLEVTNEIKKIVMNFILNSGMSDSQLILLFTRQIEETTKVSIDTQAITTVPNGSDRQANVNPAEEQSLQVAGGVIGFFVLMCLAKRAEKQSGASVKKVPGKAGTPAGVSQAVEFWRSKINPRMKP